MQAYDYFGMKIQRIVYDAMYKARYSLECNCANSYKYTYTSEPLHQKKI